MLRVQGVEGAHVGVEADARALGILRRKLVNPTPSNPVFIKRKKGTKYNFLDTGSLLIYKNCP